MRFWIEVERNGVGRDSDKEPENQYPTGSTSRTVHMNYNAPSFSFMKL